MDHITAGVEAQRQGDLDEAEAQLSTALAVARKFGAEDPRLISSLTYLGLVYHDQGRIGDAEALFEITLARLEKSLGRNNPAFASNLLLLANAYRDQKRYAEAESLIAYSKDTLEQTLGPDHPETARCLEATAALLRATAREDEAIIMEERAKTIISNWMAGNEPTA